MMFPMFLWLFACVHAPPAPMFLPPPDLPAVEPRAVALPPGGCDGAPVRPGAVLDCTGIAISYADSDLVALVEADLAVVVDRLAEERRNRLQDRALAEAALAGARARADDAEREGRWLRAAVPLAAVGGLLAGGGFAIGVLAAADGALAD